MACPPKSFSGDSQSLQTGVLGLVTAYCCTAMRNTTSSSREVIALCHSAYNAFHLQKLLHPSSVILPTNEQKGGEGILFRADEGADAQGRYIRRQCWFPRTS